jgi:phosphatidylglycerol lysyltransferase
MGFYLLDEHFAIHYGFRAALDQTLTMFFEFYNPALNPITGFGYYFASSIYIVGLSSVAFSLFLIMRPVFLRHPASDSEYKKAEKIIRKYGKSSLAAIDLLKDKSYFFSSSGSVIAFVVNSGIALALGDSIGPESDSEKSIEEFRSYSKSHDWHPAFYQTLPDYIEHYKKNKFLILCIGHEAIVDVKNFSLEGGSIKSVRTSVNRLTKLGYTTEVIQPPLSEVVLEDLRLISDDWLLQMHGSEKSFSLGWFDEEYIGNCPVMVVRSESGAAVAFANIISEFQRNEASIDLMRRYNNTPSGTMDFLFVSLFKWAESSGYETFNLGLSPLAGIGENEEDPIVEKALNFIYEHMNQFYSFKGLYSFKEKFGPSWSPRYLVYDGLGALLTTAYSIFNADSGGGLLSSFFIKSFKSARNIRQRNSESIMP